MINRLIPATVFRGLDMLVSAARGLGYGNDVMMQLGDYQFSLGTAAYDGFRRSRGWSWPEQERIGRTPALQYTGPELQTIRLSGMILPTYRGGVGQIEAMAAAAGKGEPLMLVDGRGFVYGRWCIVGLDENQSYFAPNGAARRMDFDITLVEYGEDE